MTIQIRILFPVLNLQLLVILFRLLSIECGYIFVVSTLDQKNILQSIGTADLESTTISNMLCTISKDGSILTLLFPYANHPRREEN